MKKYIPNLLTILRMLCVIPLLLLIQDHGGLRDAGWMIFDNRFLGLWLLCGVSDALDGALARRWQVDSPVGALLDTIADALLIVPILCVFWEFLLFPKRAVVVGAIFAARIIALLIGAVRFRTFVILHTWSNKLTGVLLYLYPLLIFLMQGMGFPSFVLCIAAGCAALDELLILCTTETLNRDVRGFWDNENLS